MSGPPQLKSLTEVNASQLENRSKRVSADWGSAGAMSGPPQLKSLTEVNGSRETSNA